MKTDEPMEDKLPTDPAEIRRLLAAFHKVIANRAVACSGENIDAIFLRAIGTACLENANDRESWRRLIQFFEGDYSNFDGPYYHKNMEKLNIMIDKELEPEIRSKLLVLLPELVMDTPRTLTAARRLRNLVRKHASQDLGDLLHILVRDTCTYAALKTSGL